MNAGETGGGATGHWVGAEESQDWGWGGFSPRRGSSDPEARTHSVSGEGRAGGVRDLCPFS